VPDVLPDVPVCWLGVPLVEFVPEDPLVVVDTVTLPPLEPPKNPPKNPLEPPKPLEPPITIGVPPLLPQQVIGAATCGAGIGIGTIATSGAGISRAAWRERGRGIALVWGRARGAGRALTCL